MVLSHLEIGGLEKRTERKTETEIDKIQFTKIGGFICIILLFFFQDLRHFCWRNDDLFKNTWKLKFTEKKIANKSWIEILGCRTLCTSAFLNVRLV